MGASGGSQVRCVRQGEGQTHPVMGDPMRFIMTAADTGNAYALSEVHSRPGNGAPPHIHHREEEAIYVLEGDYSVTVDGQEHRLTTGDFVHVPRGVVRSFTNVGGQMARVLILHCPGAAAGFYIGMGQLEFPPRLEEIAALGERFGIEIVLPKESS